jgi:hypothetical protein
MVLALVLSLKSQSTGKCVGIKIEVYCIELLPTTIVEPVVPSHVLVVGKEPTGVIAAIPSPASHAGRSKAYSVACFTLRILERKEDVRSISYDIDYPGTNYFDMDSRRSVRQSIHLFGMQPYEPLK